MSKYTSNDQFVLGEEDPINNNRQDTYDPYAPEQQSYDNADSLYVNPDYEEENQNPYAENTTNNINNSNQRYDDLPLIQEDALYNPESEDPEEPEQPRSRDRPERQHKYSTANMQESGKCKKYLSICALFLLFLAFMIGLSLLFNHFFFSDSSDNSPAVQQRDSDSNTTFPMDKQDVDGACSRDNFRNAPWLCTEACTPHYFKCCDPFDEMELYNFTENYNVTADEEAWTPSSVKAIQEKNYTFLQGYEDWEPESGTCSFDTDLRGCMSYAKCQVITGQIDAAPNNLPQVCSLERLEQDPQSCESICSPLDCCYSLGSDNCMADKFDLCMDYAPCQNLRILKGTNILATAPHTLDFDCYWQQPACTETCQKAKSCGDPNSATLQLNFLSCLTYSPCNNVTETNIIISPQFSNVPKPPLDIIYACNNRHESILEPTEKSCAEYCEEVNCCWSDNSDNCFFQDPLGCLAWESQCQALLNEDVQP